MTQPTLAARCAHLSDLSREALDWIETPQNAARIGPERKSMQRILRRAARRATRLGKSAATRMSVSVFGPSQAGKSFLVSVLARPTDGRLVADFSGNFLDYIQELNPEGEGESTGLVTRFTTARDPAPPGFPIHLTLLSEADLARVLINSFFMDGDKSEPVPEPAEITAHIEAYQSRVSAPQPGITYEEVIEIAEYVQNNFVRLSSYAGALASFWEAAATIAPGLSPADRAGFLSILWGQHTQMTELFRELSDTLAQIGHAEDIHVGLNAVSPRETSILDVKTLGTVLERGGDMIEVMTPRGQRVALPRSRICAIAAELVLPMRDIPHPLFEQTDLLDFPGARNRFNKSLATTLADPKSLPELLLRGKVAYLFDRYVENQEITSMLLCVPDSNMETVDLPRLVSTWIDQTHGPRPELRSRVDCILFFVLTKFDKHLGDSAAAGGEATRFQRRMEASLLEKFSAGSDNWVSHWAPQQPFRNCYWLRNPNFYVDGLIDYDDARREVRVRPEKAARIAELKTGCLSAAAVQSHFSEPEAAWEAAMALNDGGVGYLVAALDRVCKPDQKLRQISQQLARVAGDVLRVLEPYHVADDLETRIEERRAACWRIVDDLENALRQHRFGAVLGRLMVDQDSIEEHVARVPSTIRIGAAVTMANETGSVSNAPARPGGPARPGRPGPAQTPAAQTGAPAASTTGSAVRTMRLEEFQAETAISVWIEAMTAFRDDSDLHSSYGLSTQNAADLVAEIIHAARRTDLAGQIAAQLAEISFGLTVERLATPAAILSAEKINTFVATLGMSSLPEAKRPRIPLEDGADRAAFAARPRNDRVDDLPATPRNVAADTWSDWVFALDTLMQSNAVDGGGADIDIEQNLKLGTIVSGMRMETAE